MTKRRPDTSSYRTTRVIGLRKNQIFPYVVGPDYSNKSNPFRAKFRIHKGLPGYTGRDISLGNHDDECVAALAVELFVATYCMEYPQYFRAMAPLITSCSPGNIKELVHEYPIVATVEEIQKYRN